MKRVLITGHTSYIGTALEKWLIKTPDKYVVESISVKGNDWEKKDFSLYDVVYHVAGIAHVRENKENKNLYYQVNRDLAYNVAKKAKLDGVKQFIFLSTMSVYGLENGIIDKGTPLSPSNAYGKSKLEAEQMIMQLASKDFVIAILRPPMVYGRGCKGNYVRLAKIARRIPIFPEINNKRSMIYIDNLSEFVKRLIITCDSGLFFPQNDEYVKTSEMVSQIAKAHGKKIKMTKLFNPIFTGLNFSVINKVFGDLIYDMDMSEYKYNYRVMNFENTIQETEKSF